MRAKCVRCDASGVISKKRHNICPSCGTHGGLQKLPPKKVVDDCYQVVLEKMVTGCPIYPEWMWDHAESLGLSEKDISLIFEEVNEMVVKLLKRGIRRKDARSKP